MKDRRESGLRYRHMQIKSIVMFVVVTIGLLLGVGALLVNFGNSAPENKIITDVAGEMRLVKGEGEIVLVEFSDLQCPACQSVQAPLKQILSKYEGKVKLVYRHYPLNSIHKNADIASRASEAAHLQGKFWEMHDTLFEKQREWEKLGDPREKFAEYATALGLDATKFLADIESQEVKDKVAIDLLAATNYRLSGTPSFFVNGESVEFANLDSRLSSLSAN